MIKNIGLLYLFKNLKIKNNKFNIIIFDDNVNINNITIDLNEFIENKVLNLYNLFKELNKKLKEEKNVIIKEAKITFMVNSYDKLEKKIKKVILPCFENLECEFEIAFTKTYEKKIKIELGTDNTVFSKFNIILGINSPFYFEAHFLKRNFFKNLHVEVKKNYYLNYNIFKSKLNLENVKISDTLYIEGVNYLEGKLITSELNNIILKNIHSIENHFFSNIKKIKNNLLLNIIENTDIDKDLSKMEIEEKIYIESCSKKLGNFVLKNTKKVIFENLNLDNIKLLDIKEVVLNYVNVNSGKFKNITNFFIDYTNIRNSIFDNVKKIEKEKGKLNNTKLNNIQVFKAFNAEILNSNFNNLNEIYFSNTINIGLNFNNVNNLSIFLTGYIKDIYKDLEKKEESLIIETLLHLIDIIHQKDNNIKELNLHLNIKEINKKYIKEKFKSSKLLISTISKLINVVSSNRGIKLINNLDNEEIKFILYNSISLPQFLLKKQSKIKNKMITLLKNV